MIVEAKLRVQDYTPIGPLPALLRHTSTCFEYNRLVAGSLCRRSPVRGLPYQRGMEIGVRAARVPGLRMRVILLDDLAAWRSFHQPTPVFLTPFAPDARDRIKCDRRDARADAELVDRSSDIINSV